MQIISHRGFWQTSEEKNSQIAFNRSWQNNFGLETDLRDFNGELVISHDLPNNQSLKFENFINEWQNYSTYCPLALNIKSDGLAVKLATIMDKKQNYFVFDMSIPDMMHYHRANIPYLTRMSELENTPIFIESAFGIWLDAFNSTWYNQNTINDLLKYENKYICIVSSELHRRDYKELWNMLHQFKSNPFIILCTDYPNLAKEFFYGNS